jgi:hypothetical protein
VTFVASLAACAAVSVVAIEPAPAGPVEELACTVSFNMDELVSVGSLVFRVVYPVPNVRFVGTGAAVSCTKLVAQADASFVDDDAGELTATFSSETGFPGLTGLALCDMRASSEPTAGDFAIVVDQASTPAGAALVPKPAVTVLQILCEAAGTTTLPPPTTTTLPPVTTTTLQPMVSCADADGDGRVTAVDALITLRAAVGTIVCPLAACDVDGSGAVSAVDALAVLRAAVGVPVTLLCPAAALAT